MNRMIAALMLAFTLALTLVSPVSAYSYGDPNEEELATMFKDAVVRIGSGDWAGAAALYKAKRAEIESHFGTGVAVNLDISFEAKDKTVAEQNLKALMVLNLERRFEYGEKDIEDYSKSKLLLAKARATYDVLEPYVQSKLPNETAKLKASFDSALEALGNPGLFGVGKKPISLEAYKQHTSYIMDTVRPIFPGKEAQAPTAAAPVQQTAAPAASAQPSAAAAPANGTVAGTKPDPSAAPVKPSAEASAPTASTAASAAPDASASPSAAPTAAAAESVSAASATPSPAAGSAPAAAEHAPMQREDKTNAGVTFAVIGGVALAAGGTFWWARRKGIL
jgi:hypothetical protein